MKRVSLFVRARSVIAPFVRPLLETCRPVRAMGLWWLSRKHRSVIEHGGHRFEMDPKDFGVTFELEATGEYERKTRELCMSSLKPGMTFVDVGAHVGLYAIPAAAAVGPTGTVVAFDPDPDNFRLLSRNVAASGYKNIQLNNMAVSNVDGPLKLYRSPYNTGDHQIFFKGAGRESVTVQSVSLDQFFKGRTSSIDVAKFDIQGAEAAALLGMTEILANSRNLRMFIEFAPSMLEDAGADPRAFLKSIEDHGFILSIIDDAVGTVTSAGAETIVHSSRKQAYVNIMCERPQRTQ
jgi:FkbM family methyltransferase